MPRTARIEAEGGIHHVTLRGNRGQVIFRDDGDRSFFLRALDVAAREYHWAWLAYCLMSNHCHLVIETPERTLGLGMRQLAGRHAQAFNRRHGTYGHVFQGRYGSVLVDSDVHFAQLLRYVALNPVSAGLCTEPAEWRWSSHRYMLNGSPQQRVPAPGLKRCLRRGAAPKGRGTRGSSSLTANLPERSEPRALGLIGRGSTSS
jgi:putative transposase